MSFLFRRFGGLCKNAAPARAHHANAAGYLAPQSARELLSSERRQQLLAQIAEQTSLPQDLYARLYLAPLYRYAECVQLLPASESHHHSYPGGMLDHGLELMLYALRLRQSYLLPPGAAPEEQAKQSDAWTAAVALAALLHDIGKVAVDLEVESADGKRWHPWQGALKQAYRFRYRSGRDYHLHNAAAGLLYAPILGLEVLDWLSQYPQLFGSLLYLLAGDYERAGVLGEIVAKADRTSTALNVGANPQKSAQAPVRSLQSHLLRGLKQLFAGEGERLKLSQKGAAAWLTTEALWLVSKVVADKLRAALLAEGVDGIPSSNAALFNELQAHALVQANPAGQAIWHATVTDGDWVQEFTFLKVAPALIWGSAQYPPVFDGSVRANSGEAAESVPTTTRQKAIGNTTGTGKAIAPSLPAFPATAATAKSQTQNSADDSIEEALALFADIPTTDSNTAPIAGYPHAQDKDDATTTAPTLLGGETAAGEAFIDWLKGRIAARTLRINDANAPIHLVDGKVLLISPLLFQRFCQEHPKLERRKPKEEEGATWRWIQRSFEKLKIHHKQPASGLNIWTAQVKGPRKQGAVKGYLLDTTTLFDHPPPDNPFVSLAH